MTQKYIAIKDFPQCGVTRDDIVEIIRQERRPNGYIDFDGDSHGKMSANTFHFVFARISPTQTDRPETVVPVHKFQLPSADPRLDISIEDFINNGKSTCIYSPIGKIQLLQYEEKYFRAFVQEKIDKALRDNGIDPNEGTKA